MSIPLNPQEKIVKIVYKSSWVYFLPILASLLLILGACFFMVPLFGLQWWGKIIFWFLIVLGLIFGLRILFALLGNKMILTNQRVILIQQRGFFSRTVLKINYEKIKNISLSIQGFLPTILRLGTMEFSLAESQEILKFSNLSQAQQIQELILQLQSTPFKINLEQMDNYELVEMARKIRDRLGRDVLRKIVEE